MIEAYILLCVSLGKDSDVIRQLRKYGDNIKGAYATFGQYDIVAEVKVKNIAELREITFKARRIAGVRSTITQICVE